MTARFIGIAQVACGEEPAPPDDSELYAGICGGGTRFVPDDMRFLADNDVIAGPCEDLEADLICHRAARHKKCRLFAEQFGDAFLQPVDGRVLAILVVAHRRHRHRLAHPWRWRSYGVRPKI